MVLKEYLKCLLPFTLWHAEWLSVFVLVGPTSLILKKDKL